MHGQLLDGKPVFSINKFLAEETAECNVIIGFSGFSVERENIFRKHKNIHLYFWDIASQLHDYYSFKDFYIEHKSDFDQTRSLLFDEESKRSFDLFVEQRCNLSYRKPFSRKPQYFDDEIYALKENEVLIDCGAYDGDTVISFVDSLKNAGISGYKKIFAFEADPSNSEKFKKNLVLFDNIELITKGVYDHSGQLCFSGEGTTTLSISDDGIKIDITTIDEVVKDDDVTIIKMDIEGSELQALHGAEKTIKRCRPKLAICVYHKQEDLIAIPQYIQSLDLGYKFYLRNYYEQAIETVLYAI